MKARYKIAGDQSLIVQYGERFSLRLNFKILVLTHRMKMMKIRGVWGFKPAIHSILVHYDPFQISTEDLLTELKRLESGREEKNEALRSRLVRLPIVYGDRWTRACAEQNQAPPNLEFVAEHNRMSVEELVRTHSTSTFWVLYLGANPGLPVFVPIDPAKRITTPKYKVPRVWTPLGTVGMGGILTTIYTIEAPGGFQMLGRTPLLIFDPEKRNPIFENDISLFRPGDRIVFDPIDHEEFLDIEKNFSEYRYHIEEEEWTINQFPTEE